MFVDFLMYICPTCPHVKAMPYYYARFTPIGSISKTAMSIELLHSYMQKNECSFSY